MCAIEAELENLLGEFSIKMKGESFPPGECGALSAELLEAETCSCFLAKTVLPTLTPATVLAYRCFLS